MHSWVQQYYPGTTITDHSKRGKPPQRSSTKVNKSLQSPRPPILAIDEKFRHTDKYESAKPSEISHDLRKPSLNPQPETPLFAQLDQSRRRISRRTEAKSCLGRRAVNPHAGRTWGEPLGPRSWWHRDRLSRTPWSSKKQRLATCDDVKQLCGGNWLALSRIRSCKHVSPTSDEPPGESARWHDCQDAGRKDDGELHDDDDDDDDDD
ncbi:hypothetical protein GX48_05256 [Paracoccidioides brasiliensis]|nr:hypothetical protein GX48_05256 [Paracoccidioides brasiliensis]